MILALDLEGTLISNAVSQFPRPGLRDFLDFCLGAFERVVIYTAVDEGRTRRILALLAAEGHGPPELAELEIVRWSGKQKDLSFVSEDWRQVLLVDDREDYVVPSQRSQWIPIFEFTGRASDGELPRVASELWKHLSRDAAELTSRIAVGVADLMNVLAPLMDPSVDVTEEHRRVIARFRQTEAMLRVGGSRLQMSLRVEPLVAALAELRRATERSDIAAAASACWSELRP